MKAPVRSLIAQLALVAVGALTIATASAEEVVLVAPNAPPPVRYEAVPVPRDGYIWEKGHWRWEHGQYVWERGHWEVVRVGLHWVPGHWAPRGPNWVWVTGHWA
ncbi:hypothetical protein FAZ69_03935 [Trinickia terrae]|uniref:YXWGXW repeat-containing protein n=1 Tax=Trinickia terrae TaxID=2571161 RepID=A0A4U1ID82_9BURK|nr:YXWGXW repeat-containing protein [Trinickia terrae]TKC91606.1 hypothetical protein FAZ69_03935 [Trinickia terrae]